MGGVCCSENTAAAQMDSDQLTTLRGSLTGKGTAVGAGLRKKGYVRDLSEWLTNTATLNRYKEIGPHPFPESLDTWVPQTLENNDIIFAGSPFARGQAKTGYCVYISNDRNLIFEGYLDADKYGGDHSRVITPKGEVLAGTWENGTLNGKGTYIAMNNDSYIGDFLNGFFHGKGEYSFAADGRKYNGEYVSGKKHGYGTLITKDFEYCGKFDNGNMHGAGECTEFNTQERYTGVWVNGTVTNKEIKA